MSIFVTSGSGDGATAASTGWEIHRAELEIQGLYGDTVSVASKNKSLTMLGHAHNVTTAEQTLAEFDGGDTAVAHETLLTSNGITSLSSSSGSDTHTVSVEGHTISGSDLTFVVQTVTLTGQTDVLLGTPLARCSKITNTGTTDTVGIIYAHEGATTVAGVPDTSTEIHCQSESAGHNKTHKGATSISSVDYWLVEHVVISMNHTSSLELHVELQIKSTTGVWFDCFEFGLSNTGTPTFEYVPHPHLIIPPNHDVRVVATAASGTVEEATCNVSGFLASVLS